LPPTSAASTRILLCEAGERTMEYGEEALRQVEKDL